MTPKKCMSMAKSLTTTQHMEVEPLCSEVIMSIEVFEATEVSEPLRSLNLIN